MGKEEESEDGFEGYLIFSHRHLNILIPLWERKLAVDIVNKPATRYPVDELIYKQQTIDKPQVYTIYLKHIMIYLIFYSLLLLLLQSKRFFLLI